MMRIFPSLIFFLLISTSAFAQSDFLKKGNSLFAKGELYEALNIYNNGIEKYPKDENLCLQLARCNFLLNNYSESLKYYQLVKSDILFADDFVKLGLLWQSNEIYNLAIRSFEKALELGASMLLVNKYLESCKWAKKYTEKEAVYDVAPSKVVLKGFSLGLNYYKNGVVYANEAAKEVLHSDKKALDHRGHRPVDLYYIEEENNIVKGKPELLSKDLVFEGNEGSACFTKDNRTIYFTRSFKIKTSFSYRLKNKTKKRFKLVSKLYTATYMNGLWENITEYPFNSDSYSISFPSVTEDGNTLYFASNMPGSIGGFDIYRSKKYGEVWSVPENIGDVINTKGNEITPFISPHNHSLYFSSDAHKGFGGYDVFRATLNSKGEISNIKNMEKGINSARNDFAFVLNPSDSTQGFLSTNREGDGFNDFIYYVRRFPDKFKGVDTTTIEYISKGFLLDQFNQNKNWNEQRILYPEESGDVNTNNFNQVSEEEKKLKTAQEEGEIFRIQLMSSTQYYYVKAPLFQGLDIDVFKIGTDFNYTTGEFHDLTSADKYKQEVIDMGFDEAFVVEYEEKNRYGRKTTNKMMNEGTNYRRRDYDDVLSKRRKELYKEKAEEEVIEETKIEGTIYRIEFLQSDEKLHNVQIFDTPAYEFSQGSSFHYTTGEFKTSEEAERLMRKVKRAGYMDARIVKFDNGKPVVQE